MSWSIEVVKLSAARGPHKRSDEGCAKLSTYVQTGLLTPAAGTGVPLLGDKLGDKSGKSK